MYSPEFLQQKGFIPGDNENEEEFFIRVKNAYAFQKNPYSFFEKAPPIPFSNPIPWHHWDWAKKNLKKFFFVSPDWIVGFYENKKILPWQGGVCWTFFEEKKKFSFLQLRKTFKKGKLLGLYSKEELLAHEAVHVMRAGFSDSPYEELFAYFVSDSFIRRIFGPFFQKSWEPILICFPLFLIPMLGEIAFENFLITIFALLISFGSIAWLGFRLAILRYRFNKVFKKLANLLGSHQMAMQVLFRLSGREISELAKLPLVLVEEYFTLRKDLFRFRYLYENFFAKNQKKRDAL